MLMAKSRKAPKILFGRESFTRDEMVKAVSKVKELKSRKPNSQKPSILESHHESPIVHLLLATRNVIRIYEFEMNTMPNTGANMSTTLCPGVRL